MGRKTLADVTGGKVEIPDVFPRRGDAPPDVGPEMPAKTSAPPPGPKVGSGPGRGGVPEASRRAGRKASGRGTPPPEPDRPELDDATLGRWRWTLGATARKVAAAEIRANAALVAWERLATDAAAAGVPARLVVAAAADAGIETPELA